MGTEMKLLFGSERLLPVPVQAWLAMNRDVPVKPSREPCDLAVICLNLFEEMARPLYNAGYELDVEAAAASPDPVYVDYKKLHLALCSLLYALALRCPAGTEFMISAKGTSLNVWGYRMTGTDIFGMEAESEKITRCNDRERGMYFALVYLRALNVRAAFAEEEDRHGIVFEFAHLSAGAQGRNEKD